MNSLGRLLHSIHQQPLVHGFRTSQAAYRTYLSSGILSYLTRPTSIFFSHVRLYSNSTAFPELELPNKTTTTSTTDQHGIIKEAAALETTNETQDGDEETDHLEEKPNLTDYLQSRHINIKIPERKQKHPKKFRTKSESEYREMDMKIRRVLFDFSHAAVKFKKAHLLPLGVRRDPRYCSDEFHAFGVSNILEILKLREKYPVDLVYLYDYTTTFLLRFNLRNNLEVLGSVFKVKELDDWYKVSNEHALDLHNLLGAPFWKVFGMNLWEALPLAYSEHPWQPWKFRIDKDRNFKTLREWLDWFGTNMGVKTMDHWYLFSTNDFRSRGGNKFLSEFRGSVMSMLATAYPEHHWLEWRFTCPPRNMWKNAKTVRAYLDWLATMLNIKTMNEWYAVRYSDMKHYGGRTLLGYYGSVPKILHFAYPNHPWEFDYFNPVSFTKRDVPFSKSMQVEVERDPTKRLRRRQLMAEIKVLQKQLNVQFPRHGAPATTTTSSPASTSPTPTSTSPTPTIPMPSTPPVIAPTYAYVDGIYDDSEDVQEANFADISADDEIEDPLAFDFGDEGDEAPESLAASSSSLPPISALEAPPVPPSASLQSKLYPTPPPSQSPSSKKASVTEDDFDINPFEGDEDFDYDAAAAKVNQQAISPPVTSHSTVVLPPTIAPPIVPPPNKISPPFTSPSPIPPSCTPPPAIPPPAPATNTSFVSPPAPKSTPLPKTISTNGLAPNAEIDMDDMDEMDHMDESFEEFDFDETEEYEDKPPVSTKPPIPTTLSSSKQPTNTSKPSQPIPDDDFDMDPFADDDFDYEAVIPTIGTLNRTAPKIAAPSTAPSPKRPEPSKSQITNTWNSPLNIVKPPNIPITSNTKTNPVTNPTNSPKPTKFTTPSNPLNSSNPSNTPKNSPTSTTLNSNPITSNPTPAANVPLSSPHVLPTPPHSSTPPPLTTSSPAHPQPFLDDDFDMDPFVEDDDFDFALVTKQGKAIDTVSPSLPDAKAPQPFVEDDFEDEFDEIEDIEQRS